MLLYGNVNIRNIRERPKKSERELNSRHVSFAVLYTLRKNAPTHRQQQRFSIEIHALFERFIAFDNYIYQYLFLHNCETKRNKTNLNNTIAKQNEIEQHVFFLFFVPQYDIIISVVRQKRFHTPLNCKVLSLPAKINIIISSFTTARL